MSRSRSLDRLAAAVVGIEALVVLLALSAVPKLQRGHGLQTGAAVTLLAAALLAAASIQRRRGGRAVASALQVAVVVAGLLVWPLFVLGPLFAGLWLLVLAFDRDLLAGPGPPAR